MKQCNKFGCTELTRNGYCDQHQYIVEEQKARRNQFYNQQRDDVKYQQFYKSAGWKKIREQALVRDKYLCQMCLKEKKIVPAETVHHIKFVKTHWHLRLTLNNLVSLCNGCHNTIHKGKEEMS
jgi:5-methylcytosine-specific restriction enzyme A